MDHRNCELLKCGGFALASSPPFVSAYLSRVVAMARCPHGHRALEVKDVAVGMQVVYVSRDDANTLINTHITKAGVFEGSSGPCVATHHKHAALLNRLFVPQRQSSAPDEGAAVGATQTAAAAPAGESAVSPSAVAPAAAAAAAAGMEVQDEQAEIEDADTFLRHSVVPWLKAMQEEASDRKESLPAVLKMRMLASNGQPLASSLAELVLSRFRALVPWKGYVNFQQVPKSSKKAHCTFACYHTKNLFMQQMACLSVMPRFY